MKKNWTNSLKDFTMNCFQTMIAVDAEIVTPENYKDVMGDAAN